MTQSLDTNNSSHLLEKLLEGRDPQYKAKILELVNYCGITDFNDPMFLFLLATGQLQVMLADAPNDLGELFLRGNERTQQIFDKWSKEITACLLGVEAGIVQRQQRAIEQAVNSLIAEAVKSSDQLFKQSVQQSEQLIESSVKAAEIADSRRVFKSILPASAIVAFVLGLGTLIGMTVPPYLQGGYVGSRNLTAEEAASLKWASSAEGKKARDLMEWNRDYLDTCENDTKALGVKLTFGKSQADKGYCVLWTRPPQQRGLKAVK